ncbi:MAG: BACON domain-containing carbohydrate-binding protein [Bacteroidales bacterium]|nr:BACON domain-containing carbohydrate-binding protein [Bacteroidales bacterium]
MKKYMKSLLIAALAVVAAMGFTACSDDKYDGDPYFVLEGIGEGNVYSFDYKEVDTTKYDVAKKVVVRSNRPWKLVAQTENGWCRVFPLSGEGDGIIRLSVLENKVPDGRDIVYKVYLDGVEQPLPLTIRQSGSEPYIKPSANSITIGRKGGDTQFSVIANVPYTYEVRPAEDGADVSWLTVTPSAEDPNTVVLSCGLNETGSNRSVMLHIQGTGNYAHLSIDVPVTQLDAIYFENFSWMNHSDTSILGWVTDGETYSRFDKWTEEELSYGWTSQNALVYGRPGFLKLGKTGYGGDLVSPKIAEIKGVMDIAVSMQLVGYSSAGGTVDDGQVYVAVKGPGKITKIIGGDGAETGEIVSGVIYCDDDKNPILLNDVASFVLDPDNHFNKAMDPEGLKIWEYPLTNFTINVDGATSETQIIILGGAFDEQVKTIGKGKNRIFVDNFKVRER